MIPVCCLCGRSAPRWHDAEWEAAGGLQDFCPTHATAHPTLKEYIVTHMDKYPNTERANWQNVTPDDATSCELNLVHLIMGERPKHITPEQWRENMRECAKHIREHVETAQFEKYGKQGDAGIEPKKDFDFYTRMKSQAHAFERKP